MLGWFFLQWKITYVRKKCFHFKTRALVVSYRTCTHCNVHVHVHVHVLSWWMPITCTAEYTVKLPVYCYANYHQEYFPIMHMNRCTMYMYVCSQSYISYIYRSVPGKRPWALKHNSRFWPAWALTQNINSICLYGSCNSDPLKFSTWALTREWALAWDTTGYIIIYIPKKHSIL